MGASSSGRIGSFIHDLPTVDSTNEEAKRLARLGAAHGEVVLAREQTAGKGRRGRSWIGLPGQQLYLSVILRLPLEPRDAPQLVSLAAVAVAEALARWEVDARIKWPNDLQVQGKKISGILLELAATPRGVEFLVAGIGVNLEGRREELPQDIRDRTTTLEEASGRRIPRDEVAAAILQRLDHWLERLASEGFEAIRLRYVELSAVLGERVRMIEAERVIEGEAVGVDEAGALLVQVEGGGVERFLTGDVTSLRMDG